MEESRLLKARQALPAVTGRLQHLVDQAATVTTSAGLEDLGVALWRSAVGEADDRTLYWARLAIRDRLLRSSSKSIDLTGIDLTGFERASRGMTEVAFSESVQHRVLISGFDPFHLDQDITQSNPAGLAALQLDGTHLTGGDSTAQIEAVVMPVRFADFDAGLIESFFRPWLRSAEVDLIVTVSMGRDGFDLERFPGRRRSAELPDNLNILSGASAAQPIIPGLPGEPLAGPEFVEFSLPADAMSAVQGRWVVRDNRSVTTLEEGEMLAASLASLSGQTAVAGSGGGYLSNEISYRSVLLGKQLKSSIPIGHLHTPRVSGFDAVTEAAIVDQVRRILQAAIAAL